ncbi:para-aminobenzoate synthetase component 1 [Cellulomonas hominis]|uniref:Para-aminobenzoate synthetase component 1 n=1 Tax=Cellulomonas hominis TaxID=156981 RepID=A0A7W8SH10_9CELL|nr:chorismate-binding protein [Cellulomonas hominis]MBB5474955.1 para-aminobenzoate synthetase component 1 [Cellulomonas hominis]
MPSRPSDGPAPGSARFAGRVLRDPVEHVPDVALEPGRLRTPGSWVLVGDFVGRVGAWRFATAGPARPGDEVADGTADPGAWRGPDAGAWTSSLDRAAYVAAVGEVRAAIRAGTVYQANLCRVLAAPLPVDARGAEPDARALGARLAAGNPAPYAGVVHVPAGGAVPPVWVVSASPELYLRVADGWVTSAPIKGTAPTADGLTAKDRAENVMITDLVRNDLQRVCDPGTVEVTTLLGVEEHPGLVHLVSTVRGRLRDDVRDGEGLWADLLAATYPPGSVSGAPKLAALHVIRRLEPVPRGPYCGAVGWVEVGADGGVRAAELAVGIRTFVWRDGVLRFGTGAGITWGSDAEAEWAETELKARRLVALASGPASQPGAAPVPD